MTTAGSNRPLRSRHRHSRGSWTDSPRLREDSQGGPRQQTTDLVLPPRLIQSDFIIYLSRQARFLLEHHLHQYERPSAEHHAWRAVHALRSGRVRDPPGGSPSVCLRISALSSMLSACICASLSLPFTRRFPKWKEGIC